MSTPHQEITAVAEDIADQLEESHPPARLQIRRVVEQVGVEAAYDFLRQTLEVEAQGGMLTNDKQRKRTPGGTYFYIVRGKVSPEVRRTLWSWNRKKTRSEEESATAPDKERRPGRPASQGAGKPPAKRQPPVLPWAERERLSTPALVEKGAATTVKITLVGRPGKVIERQDAVILTMTGPKPPALPKGLPVLPETAVTVYLVYVARKQWNKVAPSLQNPEDKLIIEGYPFMDAKLSVIGVLTQSANTVLLQRALRSSA